MVNFFSFLLRLDRCFFSSNSACKIDLLSTSIRLLMMNVIQSCYSREHALNYSLHVWEMVAQKLKICFHLLFPCISFFFADFCVFFFLDRTWLMPSTNEVELFLYRLLHGGRIAVHEANLSLLEGRLLLCRPTCLGGWLWHNLWLN